MVPVDVGRALESGLNVTLGHPRRPDVFITAAEDIRNLRTSSQIAARLGIEAEPFAVVEFEMSSLESLVSPINRSYDLFVGFGRTIGGARK